MTLPVSSYEELLARVRNLTSETIQLRREITMSLCDQTDTVLPSSSDDRTEYCYKNYATYPQRSSSSSEEQIQSNTTALDSLRLNDEHLMRTSPFNVKKEEEIDTELKEIDERHNSPDTMLNNNSCYRSDWGPESLGLWHSGPSSLSLGQTLSKSIVHQDEGNTSSLTSSFALGTQSLHSFSTSSRAYGHQNLGAKVEMVYNLLSMLGTNNREDMSKTFLAMSSSSESCHAMRQSGCIPLLVQLIHSPELDKEVRSRAAEALHNIVHAQIDEKRRRREVRVLKLLQQVREYCDELKASILQEGPTVSGNSEKHPVAAVGALMKFSFDAEHRQAICVLGGLHAITELIQLDHEAHCTSEDDSLCLTLRRYAGMSLTNLTFGDGKNKALLCGFNKFMRALVAQLKSPSEDLRQVTASVLRNLSWRADSESKQALRDVGAVAGLTAAAMEAKKESTLKSVLSALWNLSAHCSMNKVDICSVPGALAFLVKMLRYKSTLSTLAIVENAGGIVRNISSHIAVREDYRQILRDNNCFEILLEQLQSPSLTIVSNACGTLWNLSARCTEDQLKLWEMGAVSMLKNLVQSKHKMISMGSSAALKNLLTANPNGTLQTHIDSTARSLGLQSLPTLSVRKQRALEQEIDITLAETCENIEFGGSPTHMDKLHNCASVNKSFSSKHSSSRESVMSTKSDSACDRLNQKILNEESKVLENKNTTLHGSLNEKETNRKTDDEKIIKRYKASMIPTPAFKKVSQEKISKNKENNFLEEIVDSTSADVESGSKVDHSQTREKPKRGIPVLKIRPKSKNFDSLIQDQLSLEKEASKECEKFSMNNESTVEVNLYNSSQNSNSKSNPKNECNSSKPREIERKSSVNDKKKNLLDFSSHENPVKTSQDKVETNSSKINSLENFENLGDNNHENRNKISIQTELENCSYNQKVLKPKFCQKFNSSPIEIEDSENMQNGSNFEDDKLFQSETNFFSLSNDASVNNLTVLQSKASYPDRVEAWEEPPSLQFTTKISPSSIEKIETKDEASTSGSENFELSVNNLIEENGESCLTKSFTQDLPKVNTIKISSDKASDSGIQSSSSLEMDIMKESYGAEHNVQDNFFETNLTTENISSFSTSHFTAYNNNDKSINNENNSDLLAKNEEMDIDDVHYTENVSELSDKINKCEEIDIALNKKSNCNISNVTSLKEPPELTNSKFLQSEANKICNEIRKYQEMDMGCSLNSEVSLISCTSFLDPNDYSLFDFNNDQIDLDEIETSGKDKNLKTFHLSMKKPSMSSSHDYISLPSLGSLKNEAIDAMDLESSIISIASLASEMAETSLKDKDLDNTSTLTYDYHGIEVGENLLEKLNTNCIGNNYDYFDDDNSLRSQENLPLDSASFAECSLNETTKKLTPRERRKTVQERYRTYTIKNVKAEIDAEANIEKENIKLNPIENRLENKTRFLTQKLGTSDECFLTEKQGEDCYGEPDIIECTQGWDLENIVDGNSGYNHEPLENDISTTYVEDDSDNEQHTLQNDYCAPTVYYTDSTHDQMATKKIRSSMTDSKSLNDLLVIGPAERKELAENARLVALTLKTASLEVDSEPGTISDSEAEYSRKTQEIDTATYNKNQSRLRQDFFQEQFLDDPEYSSDTDINEFKGPRILKPNENNEEQNLEEISKVVRGRRKKLYSTPLKKFALNQSTPNSPKISQTSVEAKKFSLTTTKSLPNVPKTILNSCAPSAIQREGTFTKEESTFATKSAVKSATAIPVFSKHIDSKISNKPTFRNKSAPVLKTSRSGSEGCRISRPVSSSGARATEKRIDLDSSRSRHTYAGPEKIALSKVKLPKGNSSSASTPQELRTSSSSHSLKSSSSCRNISNIRSKNTTNEISKHLGGFSSSPVLSSGDKSKPKTPKKEISSKIANLWKKVEQSKEKSKNTKDNRVWICSEKSSKEWDENSVLEREEILEIPTGKIVQSSTVVQNPLDERRRPVSSKVMNKASRHSESFVSKSRHEVLKLEKSERKNVISAIVQPYNYNPPGTVKVTSSAFEQMEPSVKKNSLKLASDN